MYGALNGNLTGPVYDHLPRTKMDLYTVIGETAAESAWDTHDSDGSDEEPVIHIWSKAEGSVALKAEMALIDERLHWAPLAVAGAQLVSLRRVFSTVIREEIDGEVWRHGVMRYRALITE